MALDGPQTRDTEVKPPRTNGGRQLPGKRSHRPRLSGLGAKTAAAAAIAAAAVILLGGLVLARTGGAIRDLERAQYAGMAADARLRLDRLVGRDRDRMMNAAFSDGLYELLARGAAPPDTFIRPTFAGQFPAQYGDRFVGVYDLGGKRLYAWADAGQSQLETVAGNALFRVLDNREPSVGLIRQGDQLFWVAGAPVLPTNYTAANQPIRGYVVVAQPFNPNLIAPGVNGRPGRVELTALEPAKEAFRTQVGPAASSDSIQVNFALSDIFAQQNTLATITTGRGEFRSLEGRIRSLAGLGILAVFGLAAAGYFAARRFLVAPVERLSQVLAPVHTGQTPGLIGSIGAAAEWNAVVQAVNRLVSNSRSFGEHFERLANVVTEGAWERDLGSGEWTVTARFRELVGYQAGEFPTPIAALAARLDPNDAAVVLGWLEAELPSPRSLTADVRVRRNGGFRWLRLSGEVTSVGPGLPSRVIGLVADLTGAQEAAAKVAEAARTLAHRRSTDGRFLSGLAPRLAADPVAAQQLDYIGRGMAGTLGTESAPCDLFALLQVSAGTKELSIVPGVPEQVMGDQVLLKAAIDLLLGSSAEGRTMLRADQPDRGRPEQIRIAIDDRTPTNPETIATIGTVLTTGEHPAGEVALTWRALHALAKALGGVAGIDGDPAGTRRWITVPLPPVAEPPAAPADLEYHDPAAHTWDSDQASPAVENDYRPDHAMHPARPSQRVELVADATVTINLDDTTPAPTAAPIGAQFIASLAAGDPAAHRAASAAMAEIPARLLDLKGHATAGEIGAVIDGSETVARVAAVIGASDLVARCRDVIDAAESQYLDAGDDLVLALDAAWTRTAEALAPHLHSPEPRTPPIDSATLEQLTLSLGDGGLGTQLVEHVLTEAPGLVEAIEEAAEKADWPAMKASATDLNGMCALIGAAPLAARCSAAAAAVGSDGWTEALAIRTEWNRVVEVLDRLMGARSGAITQ